MLLKRALGKGIKMLDRFVESVLNVAAVVAGWFVPPGAHKFGLIQMGVSLLLVTALIALVAFWRHARSRRRHARDDAQG